MSIDSNNHSTTFCAKHLAAYHAGQFDAGKFCTECPSAHDACRFDGVVEMTAGSDAKGWPIRYRQLHLGKMTAWLKLQTCTDVSLQYLYTSGRIEWEGITSEDHVTVFITAGPGPVWINGRTFDQTGFFILDSNSPVHGVSPEEGRVLSMQVPCSLLQKAGRKGFADWRENIEYPGVPLTPDFMLLDRLRSLMSRMICYPGARQAAMSDPNFELASLLATAIHQGSGTSTKPAWNSSCEALRTITQARNYIEVNLAEPIAMTDVCHHAATSLSKLERTFRKELKVTPSQYILTRRLNRVHRKLKLADDKSTRVVHVALDHGFKHLGRFSSYYHTQFGELPSQTLGSILQP